MAIQISSNLLGIESTTRKLEGIKRGLKNRILRKALTRGIKPLADHTKWLASVSHQKPLIPGLLRKSIGQKVKVKGNRAYAIAGTRTGFKRQIGVRVKGKNVGQPIYQDPNKYGHLVEGGHGGPAPAGPHPFAGLAWQAGRWDAEQSVADEIEKGIAEEVKKG